MSSLIDRITSVANKKHAAPSYFHPFAWWKKQWKRSDEHTKRFLEIGVKEGLMVEREYSTLNSAGAWVKSRHWADKDKMPK